MDVSHYLKDEHEPEPYILEGEARVWIRRVTPKRFEQVQAQHTRTKARGARVVERINGRAVTEQILDETIVRWENLENDDGLMECVRATKIQLYDYWPLFRRVWNEAILEYLGLDEELQEGLEGN